MQSVSTTLQCICGGRLTMIKLTKIVKKRIKIEFLIQSSISYALLIT